VLLQQQATAQNAARQSVRRPIIIMPSVSRSLGGGGSGSSGKRSGGR